MRSLRFLIISSFILSCDNINRSDNIICTDHLTKEDSVLFCSDTFYQRAEELARWYYYILNYKEPIVICINNDKEEYHSVPEMNVKFRFKVATNKLVSFRYVYSYPIYCDAHPPSINGISYNRQEIYYTQRGNLVFDDTSGYKAKWFYEHNLKLLINDLKKSGINNKWSPWFKNEIIKRGLVD